MIVLSHSALVMLNVHINFNYAFGKNALSAVLMLLHLWEDHGLLPLASALSNLTWVVSSVG